MVVETEIAAAVFYSARRDRFDSSVLAAIPVRLMRTNMKPFVAGCTEFEDVFHALPPLSAICPFKNGYIPYIQNNGESRRAETVHCDNYRTNSELSKWQLHFNSFSEICGYAESNEVKKKALNKYILRARNDFPWRTNRCGYNSNEHRGAVAG